ncbi:MAG: hypothetical protein ACP5JE_04735 [Thermoplasmata archaeon]
MGIVKLYDANYNLLETKQNTITQVGYMLDMSRLASPTLSGSNFTMLPYINGINALILGNPATNPGTPDQSAYQPVSGTYIFPINSVNMSYITGTNGYVTFTYNTVISLNVANKPPNIAFTELGLASVFYTGNLNAVGGLGYPLSAYYNNNALSGLPVSAFPLTGVQSSYYNYYVLYALVELSQSYAVQPTTPQYFINWTIQANLVTGT